MPEFLDAFEELVAGLGSKELKDGLTVEELAIKTGKHPDWIKDKLRLLAAANRLIVGRKKQMGLDGRSTLVPAYKIAPVRNRERGR